MNSLLLSIGAVAATMTTPPSTSVANRYLVSMDIHDNGDVVAKPRLILLPGKPGQVSVGSTQRLYEVSFSVTADHAKPELMTIPIKFLISWKDADTVNRRMLTTTVSIAPQQTLHLIVPPSGKDNSPVSLDVKVESVAA